MKKFISMVMAAAMVVSLVPATAFAADAKATVKVVDSKDLTEGEAKQAIKALSPLRHLQKVFRMQAQNLKYRSKSHPLTSQQQNWQQMMV